MGGRGSSSSLLSGANKTLLKLENGRKGLKYEMVSIVTPKGKVLKTYIGNGTEVDLAKPLKKNKEIFEGNILTHNHPAEYNILSHDDTKLLGNTKLKEMRASDNNYTYSLKKGEGRYNNRFWEKHKEAWKKSEDKAYKDLQKDSSINYMQRATEYQHKWLQRNAKKHGYIYKRIKR